MQNRYLIEKNYEIVYFNDQDLMQMAEMICFSVKSLNDDKVFASKISYKIDENQLTVSVSYKYFAVSVEQTNQVAMEKYSVSIEL